MSMSERGFQIAIMTLIFVGFMRKKLKYWGERTRNICRMFKLCRSDLRFSQWHVSLDTSFTCFLNTCDSLGCWTDVFQLFQDCENWRWSSSSRRIGKIQLIPPSLLYPMPRKFWHSEGSLTARMLSCRGYPCCKQIEHLDSYTQTSIRH